MSEETTRRELRIPLPQAEERECFLAISYDGLDEIDGAISTVMSAWIRMRLKRAKDYPESDDFNYNVVQGIRRSDAVIAVINNKKDHLCPINANVAYEIGIAHALEKPLIIVAQDIKQDQYFFADIKKFLWIDTHKKGFFDSEIFKRDLQISLANELTKPYTSKTWGDARIIERRLINADGLENAFRYGKQVHETFQHFVRGHVTPLSEAALTLSYGRAIDPREYGRIYEFYQSYYERPVKPLLDKISTLRDGVVNANSSWRHRDLRYHCDKVYEATSSIRDYYDNVKRKHDDDTGQIGKANAARNITLCAEIDNFRRHCTDVISVAGAYLTCLVETLIQINKEQRSD